MDSKNRYFLALYLALVLLATPLNATLPIFILYAAFACAVGWMLGMRSQTMNMSAAAGEKPREKAFLAITIGIFALTRFMPFMRWGWSALGADMGAYYGNWNECFASLAACANAPLALTGYPFHALGFGTQTILIAFHIAASAGIGTAAYLIARDRFGKHAGMASAFAYAVSLPQFLFYWSFFLKMEIAVMLSLFAIHAYAKNPKRAGICAALAGIVHPLTLLPLIGAFMASGIANNKKRHGFIITGAAILVTLAFHTRDLVGYAAYIATYVKGTYGPVQAELFTGHFVGFSFYHNALMLFYVPFALIAIVWCVAEKKIPLIAWYALVNLFLVSTNALFHNRFIVMFDVGSIVLAGTTLSAFALRQKTHAWKRAVLLLMAMLAGYASIQSARMEPLVNRAEFNELLALRGTNGNMPIFANNTVYRQFIAGYTGHPVLLTPFGEEPWKKLPAPSLIYNARRATPFVPADDARFSRVSEHFLKYDPT